MILYNSNKEFIGADEKDLNTLGYANLAAMQAESADFADLFVKTPGHVHNFQHVHWIDFVLCAKSLDESKAIIHANNNNYKVNLEIKTIYLSNAPATKAYMIILNNLRLLSNDEKLEITNDLENRTTPQVAPIVIESKSPIIEDEYDIVEQNIESLENEILTNENTIIDEYEKPSSEVELINDPYETDAQDTQDDYAIDIYEESDDELVEIDEDENEYLFDPKKTAEALEMPISLIEEFVEDFVNQALEFKEPLYKAVENDDMVELQSYSHKLKGVAANLRVDDAFEILTKINKAKDFTTSKRDLDIFYQTISKLSKSVLNKQIEQESAINKNIEPIDDNRLEIIEDDFDLEIGEDDKNDYVDDDLLIIDDDLELDDSSLEYTENIEVEKSNDDDALIISDEFDELDNELNEIIDELENENSQDTQTKKYDKKLVANEIGIDQESFDELFSDYINDSQLVVSQIEEAITNDDSETWKKLALNLKGMSDNMRVNSFIAELEILITTNDSIDAKNALHEIQAGLFDISEAKD